MLGLALLTSGCDDAPAADRSDTSVTPMRVETAAAAHLPCPDKGPRLPLTGLCVSRAVKYLHEVDGGTPEKPDGCEWVVQETATPGGDVLLYRALQCAGRATKLAWSAIDTQSAQLKYESSALGHKAGDLAVTITGMEEGNPGAGALAFARAALGDPGKTVRCVARKSDVADWPADALVIDAWPGTPAGGACGPFGFQPGTPAYWREFQHQSWFFQLGPGRPEFDPGSFTLITWDGQASRWSRAQ